MIAHTIGSTVQARMFGCRQLHIFRKFIEEY